MISQIFVTYDDFKLFMNNHKYDFCYWLDGYIPQKISTMYGKSRKISAMFIEEIANKTNGLVWTEWASSSNDMMERVLKLKEIKEIYQNSPCVNQLKSEHKYEIQFLTKESAHPWTAWSACINNKSFRRRKIISNNIRKGHKITKKRSRKKMIILKGILASDSLTGMLF